LTGVLLALAVGAVSAQPTWQTQTSGVTARLRGVSAVSARVAWASGSGGTLLRTLNGGETWTKLAPPAGAEKLDFRDIDAFSDRLAYALSIGNGETSRIYKTTDGGATWTLQFANTDPKVFLDAMAFWDADRGIAFSDSVDDRFVILRTFNGGQSWDRVPQDGLPSALPGEGAFAASGTNVAMAGRNHVWIGTTASRVLHSSDGGLKWTVATTPITTGNATGIFSVAFRDAQHGVVVGGDYSKESQAGNNAAYTSDGGLTWTLTKDRSISGFRSVAAWVPGTRSLVAVGPAGVDWSADDGHSWAPVTGDGFDTFSFAPETTFGWASGSAGRIARFYRASQ
jgi:photosystem II stability/assembly factor-like uncharacterized protein